MSSLEQALSISFSIPCNSSIMAPATTSSSAPKATPPSALNTILALPLKEKVHSASRDSLCKSILEVCKNISEPAKMLSSLMSGERTTLYANSLDLAKADTPAINKERTTPTPLAIGHHTAVRTLAPRRPIVAKKAPRNSGVVKQELEERSRSKKRKRTCLFCPGNRDLYELRECYQQGKAYREKSDNCPP
ncbi:hypothetical protein BDZ45DRAFT_151188 [Acephala macrosclerotiorum]|nr:hypothetical protein BDZ45DRAFT_151188 [Acephala macrosclerotiorum]